MSDNPRPIAEVDAQIKAENAPGEATQHDQLRVAFDAALKTAPAFHEDFQQHRAWAEAFAWFIVRDTFHALSRPVEQAISAAQAGQAQGVELLLETLRAAEYAMRENGMHCHGAYQQVCRVLEASPAPAVDRGLSVAARESDQQLMRFYSVETIDGLIDMMERHITRLQEKLAKHEKPVEFAPQRVREG